MLPTVMLHWLYCQSNRMLLEQIKCHCNLSNLHCLNELCYSQFIMFEDVEICYKFPVHKKTKSCDLEDFRAINIPPAMSKIFEILLKCQIQEFLHEDNLRCDLQSGHRKEHSTALLKVSSDIKIAMDKRPMKANCNNNLTLRHQLLIRA